MKMPKCVCPLCNKTNDLNRVITAQSNQNVIYKCLECDYTLRNIQVSKG